MLNNDFSLNAQAIRERNILKNVYIWMTAGLFLTGIVSLMVSTNPTIMRALYSQPFLLFGILIAEIALVIYLSARLSTMSVSNAVMGFATYSILNGITLSLIFLIYTKSSITNTFFITAGTFGAMSIYAISTKRDLSSWGHYLHMAIIGLIIASLVNFFLRSPAFYWLTSVAGVIIFTGLTAYDTQIIKKWSSQMSNSVSEDDYIKISIMGALKLYLDFINLFLFMLRIFGRRR